MSGVTGDFGRLTATINALKSLSNISSQVAAEASPDLTLQMQIDALSERNPYGKAFQPHSPNTTKRWGPHPILDMSGGGISSLKAEPMASAGIMLTADEHMRFSQGGTENEPVRATLPNRPGLPASYRKILEDARDTVIIRRMYEAGAK